MTADLAWQTMLSVSTRSLMEQSVWVRRCAALFVVALIVWTASAAILGVPHGPGHSIESMKIVEVTRDISLPLWIGGFVGILGALSLDALRITRRTAP